jgi:hypothetical protein
MVNEKNVNRKFLFIVEHFWVAVDGVEIGDKLTAEWQQKGQAINCKFCEVQDTGCAKMCILGCKYLREFSEKI